MRISLLLLLLLFLLLLLLFQTLILALYLLVVHKFQLVYLFSSYISKNKKVECFKIKQAGQGLRGTVNLEISAICSL